MGESNNPSFSQPTSDLPTTPFDPNRNLSDQPTAIEPGSDAADAYREAAIGSLLDGRYRVLDVRGGPGRSGMGVVYIVEADGLRYAAKTFQHQFSRNLPLVQRFLREARTWILTGFHEHIVHAYFLDIIGAVPYLFMEYIESDEQGRVSLADHLRKAPVPLSQAIEWAIQCCTGMMHATSSVTGLVHRDLKPENLLIANGRALKITDFGLVRCHLAEGLEALAGDMFANRTNLTQVGTAFGTPAYMAPEQFAAADEVSETADIYAFGCCFYEAISGSRVFTIRADTALDHLLIMRRMHESEAPIPLRERVRECPQDLDRIIMRCLEKKPEDRWQTFAALREQLLLVQRHVLRDEPQPAAWKEPTAEQVGEQLRSLTVLDGYSRAIRLQDLRDQQDTSPYVFHLALASFFRSMNEPEEERRQLEKAVLCRTVNEGYEAVRRLADLYIQNGEFSAARQVLDSFLVENPQALEACLEPVVHLHIVRQEFGEAETVLNRFGTTLRTDLLRAALYRAQGRPVEMAQLWRRHIALLLETIQRKIAEIELGDRVGWEQEGDADILATVMQTLVPDCDTARISAAEHAVWPDLNAYPDFSADMAWLSNALGELAESACDGDVAEKRRAAKCAELLGHPDRLQRHLTRDETWFWSSDEAREPT